MVAAWLLAIFCFSFEEKFMTGFYHYWVREMYLSLGGQRADCTSSG